MGRIFGECGGDEVIEKNSHGGGKKSSENFRSKLDSRFKGIWKCAFRGCPGFDNIGHVDIIRLFVVAWVDITM